MEDSQDAVLNQAMDEYEESMLLNAVYDRFERQRAFQSRLIQQSGGFIDRNQPGRFEFQLQPHQDRNSARMGVRERIFRNHTRQTGNFIDRPQLVPALQDGLARAINQVLENDMADRLYFTIGSNRLNHNFQGWGLTAGEWRNGGNQVDTIFNRLSNALNSNEQFEMNDSFDVTITRVRQAPRGSGHKRKLKPGHRSTKVMKMTKKSIIPIKNSDELCCARAIVTAKARVDKHKHLKNIRQGYGRQRELALQLHRKAGVPEGNCGYAELVKFQQALPNYRLIVVYADNAYDRRAFSGPGVKLDLVLLHSGNHYEVITSLPGFFATGYVCAHCLKPYDNIGKHRCNAENSFCLACRQPNCVDYLEALPQQRKPEHRCHFCRRAFYGEQCFNNHLNLDRQHKKNPGNCVCLNLRRCAQCFKLEDSFEKIARHKCDHGFCPSCEKYVELATHKCFMEEEDEEETKPTFHIYFDIEAMQIHGSHEPNLLICETDEEEEPIEFHGTGFVAEFLEFVEECTEEDERSVTVVAYNFQGYDGYFIVNNYYGNNQIIEQIRNDAKLVEVRHDSVRFIDSLSFFQMPLSAFPKTFGLTELKKGFFPHLFNVPDNQNYVGEIPAKDYFMVESMSVDGKKEFEKWHAEQLRNHVVFDFQKELVEYCRSDVKLLKQGCMVFQEKFMTYSGLNPFDKITLASACNEDLRRNCLIKNAIASEPVMGWGGSSGNQSKTALEWLHWKDHELRQTALNELTEEDMEAHDLMGLAYPDYPHPAYRNYVQHGGNAGEFKIPETNLYVDGYHEESNTVFQFHRCFWHGC